MRSFSYYSFFQWTFGRHLIHMNFTHICIYIYIWALAFPLVESDLWIMSVSIENDFMGNIHSHRRTHQKLFQGHRGCRRLCRAPAHLHIYSSHVSRCPHHSSDHMDFHSRPWETRNRPSQRAEAIKWNQRSESQRMSSGLPWGTGVGMRFNQPLTAPCWELHGWQRRRLSPSSSYF